jgi:cytochrome P450
VERTEGEKKAEAKLGDVPLKPPYSGGRGLDFIGHVAHSRTASGFPVIGSKRAMGDQITALVFGGIAPVASLLAWALYELARNPEAQRKAAQDVEAAIENGISTEETVWKADYLAAVLWETLRLHPPQPNIFRKLDSALKVGGKRSLCSCLPCLSMELSQAFCF